MRRQTLSEFVQPKIKLHMEVLESLNENIGHKKNNV